jgi:hypothetical protein
VCKKRGRLNSHHIYTRNKKSVRWDLKNGITLCVGCHTFSSKFSAHGTPTEFTYWLHKNLGNEFMNTLMAKAHAHSKLHEFEKKIILDQLLAYIELNNQK